MRSDRTAPVAIAAGVLLLAAMVGFAVGLPKVADAPVSADAEVSDVPAAELLPDTLVDGSLLPLGERNPMLAEANDAQEAAITDRLEGFYDVGAAVRYYASEDRSVLLGATVLDESPGLFQPGGPPVEITGPLAERAGNTEMVEYGDVLCSLRWGSQEQIDESGGLPETAQCQRGYAGRTFEVLAHGLAPDQAAAALNEIVGHAETTESAAE